MSSTAAAAPAASSVWIPNATSAPSHSTKSPTALPTAALVAIGVVCGLIAIFLAHRIYRLVFVYRQKKRLAVEIPKSRPPTSYYNSGKHSPGPSMQALFSPYAGNDASSSLLFDQRQSSFVDDSSLGRPDSVTSFGYNEKEDSASPSTSPPSATPPTFANTRDHSTISTDILRSQGSRSSMLGARASFYGNQNSLTPGQRRSMLGLNATNLANAQQTYLGTGPHTAGSYTSGSLGGKNRRLSGAPHQNRIEIVPPLPLAPPPGTVVATDKATLAFSSLSGIGAERSNSEWFTNPHTRSADRYHSSEQPWQHEPPSHRRFDSWASDVPDHPQPHGRTRTPDRHNVSRHSTSSTSSQGPFADQPRSAPQQRRYNASYSPDSPTRNSSIVSEPKKLPVSTSTSDENSSTELEPIATRMAKSPPPDLDSQSPLEKLQMALQLEAKRTSQIDGKDVAFSDEKH